MTSSSVLLQLLLMSSNVYDNFCTTATPTVYSVAMSGGNVDLHCAANRSSSTRWLFRSNWLAEEKSISIGQTVNIMRHLPDRHRYGFHTNESMQLSISDLKLTDAGTFRCLEDGEDIVIINLAVLATEPHCSSNVSLKALNVSDVVQIHCQVDYIGRLYPTVGCHSEIKNEPVEPLPPIKTDNSTFRHVEFVFNVVVDRTTHNTKFLCTTAFMSYVDSAVIYNKTWISSTVSVYGMEADPAMTTTWRSGFSVRTNTFPFVDQAYVAAARERTFIIAIICITVVSTVALVVCGILHVKKRNPAGCLSAGNTQSPDVGVHAAVVYDDIVWHQNIAASAAESHPGVSSTNITYENVGDQYERLDQPAAETTALSVYAKLTNINR